MHYSELHLSWDLLFRSQGHRREHVPSSFLCPGLYFLIHNESVRSHKGKTTSLRLGKSLLACLKWGQASDRRPKPVTGDPPKISTAYMQVADVLKEKERKENSA